MATHAYPTREKERNRFSRHGFSGGRGFGDMNWQYSGLVCPAFSPGDILRPFAKGGERNIVEFAVLQSGKTAGAPVGYVLNFLLNEPSLF